MYVLLINTLSSVFISLRLERRGKSLETYQSRIFCCVVLHIYKAGFTHTFAWFARRYTTLLKRLPTKLFEAPLRWNSVDIANVRIGYWMCWSLIRLPDNAFPEKILRERFYATKCGCAFSANRSRGATLSIYEYVFCFAVRLLLAPNMFSIILNSYKRAFQLFIQNLMLLLRFPVLNVKWTYDGSLTEFKLFQTALKHHPSKTLAKGNDSYLL